MSRHEFVVAADDKGLRLDQLLAARVDGLSRRRARKLLGIGAVFVDGKRVKVAGRMLSRGQVVVVNDGGALEVVATQDSLYDQVEIVHEDADIVVVNKPAGLHTVPTPESDQANLEHYLRRERADLWTVHRIDMPTSGLLVFAKTQVAQKSLAEAFRQRDVGRVYWVIVDGQLTAPQTVDAPIDGKQAITQLLARETAASCSWIEARLQTGRTHQIRIHCQRIGHPVVGDPRYGGREWRLTQIGLHAHHLSFTHPDSGQRATYEVPWPQVGERTLWEYAQSIA